jgi:hypothetical protein
MKYEVKHFSLCIHFVHMCKERRMKREAVIVNMVEVLATSCIPFFLGKLQVYSHAFLNSALYNHGVN